MGLSTDNKEQSEVLHPVMMPPVNELSFQIDYTFESPQISFFMPLRES